MVPRPIRATRRWPAPIAPSLGSRSAPPVRAAVQTNASVGELDPVPGAPAEPARARRRRREPVARRAGSARVSASGPTAGARRRCPETGRGRRSATSTRCSPAPRSAAPSPAYWPWFLSWWRTSSDRAPVDRQLGPRSHAIRRARARTSAERGIATVGGDRPLRRRRARRAGGRGRPLSRVARARQRDDDRRRPPRRDQVLAGARPRRQRDERGRRRGRASGSVSAPPGEPIGRGREADRALPDLVVGAPPSQPVAGGRSALRPASGAGPGSGRASSPPARARRCRRRRPSAGLPPAIRGTRRRRSSESALRVGVAEEVADPVGLILGHQRRPLAGDLLADPLELGELVAGSQVDVAIGERVRPQAPRPPGPPPSAAPASRPARARTAGRPRARRRTASRATPSPAPCHRPKASRPARSAAQRAECSGDVGERGPGAGAQRSTRPAAAAANARRRSASRRAARRPGRAGSRPPARSPPAWAGSSGPIRLPGASASVSGDEVGGSRPPVISTGSARAATATASTAARRRARPAPSARPGEHGEQGQRRDRPDQARRR